MYSDVRNSAKRTIYLNAPDLSTVDKHSLTYNCQSHELSRINQLSSLFRSIEQLFLPRRTFSDSSILFHRLEAIYIPIYTSVSCKFDIFLKQKENKSHKSRRVLQTRGHPIIRSRKVRFQASPTAPLIIIQTLPNIST